MIANDTAFRPDAARRSPPGDSDTIPGNRATGPFAAVTVLFFFWGFITVMNDVLIPFLKSSFELSYFQAGLVQFAFFGAFFVISLIYFAFSVSSGDPINRVGYQRTIVTALVICAAGCALFSPAAAAESYAFFLAALSGIIAAVVIAASRAIGETTIVLLAAGNRANFTFDPGQPMQTMAAFIGFAGIGDQPTDSTGYRTIFAVGSLLFVITFVLNMVSRRIVRRFREVYE